MPPVFRLGGKGFDPGLQGKTMRKIERTKDEFSMHTNNFARIRD
ncbi:hypothetical protein J2Y48_000842 [Mycoplana sp. BE70]|nr:hypothetical protein [Mycoplana sp. BE70]